MINFDGVTKENIKKHSSNWPRVLDHPYRILIIWGSGSGKTNSLLNIISHQSEIDKIYLHPKYPYETKYQLLVNKRESIGLKRLNDSKVFFEYSDDMNDVYKKYWIIQRQ